MIALQTVAAAAALGRYNVLMIGVDDLRPAGSAFGHAEIQTPHIDRLAARGTIFTQAFVQASTCGVSRSSLLTGRRPDTTYVLSNGQCPFAGAHSEWQSIPELFRASAYATAGAGKVFHPDICEGAAVGERAEAWSESYFHAPCISLGSIYNGSCYEDYPGPLPEGPGGKVTSILANGTDDDQPDGIIARHAVESMAAFAASGRPFFMAVGFHKPHLPHIAPQKYFDLYPLNEVALPSEASRSTPEGIPKDAWSKSSEMLSYKDAAHDFKLDGFSEQHHVGDELTRRQRQAYYAAASYSDAMIGRVLAALETHGLAESTVVALWGDHGWHLGENNHWAKHTAMRWANNAPLIFVRPGQTPSVVHHYAEFVDIMPTLAELAGLDAVPLCRTEEMSQTARNCTEGRSLAAWVEGEQPTPSVASFSQWPRGSHTMGYIIFTRLGDGSPARYTEWVGYANHTPVWSTFYGAELYNHTADPDENLNIVGHPSLAHEVKHLSDLLRAGWRGVAGQVVK